MAVSCCIHALFTTGSDHSVAASTDSAEAHFATSTSSNSAPSLPGGRTLTTRVRVVAGLLESSPAHHQMFQGHCLIDLPPYQACLVKTTGCMFHTCLCMAPATLQPSTMHRAKHAIRPRPESSPSLARKQGTYHEGQDPVAGLLVLVYEEARLSGIVPPAANGHHVRSHSCPPQVALFAQLQSPLRQHSVFCSCYAVVVSAAWHCRWG